MLRPSTGSPGANLASAVIVLHVVPAATPAGDAVSPPIGASIASATTTPADRTPRDRRIERPCRSYVFDLDSRTPAPRRGRRRSGGPGARSEVTRAMEGRRSQPHERGEHRGRTGQTGRRHVDPGGRLMGWDFSTEPEFQESSTGSSVFCREEVEPLEFVFPYAGRIRDPKMRALVEPLQAQVRARDSGPSSWTTTWAGRASGSSSWRCSTRSWAEVLVGPVDIRLAGSRHRQHGDARRLRHSRAKRALVEPTDEPGDLVCLLDDRAPGRLRPEPVRTHAVRDGEEWVINGEKWFTSAGRRRRHPLRDVHQRHVRGAPHHARCRDPTRPAQPRPHHLQRRAGPPRSPARSRRRRQGARPAATWAVGGSTTPMRTIAQCKLAFDMMCERALSRESHGKVIAEHQMVQRRSPTPTPSIRCCACSCCGPRGRSTTRARKRRVPDSRR